MPASERRRRLLVVAGYVAVGLLFLWPLLLHPTYIGGGDWALFHFFEESFLRAFWRHGEVALWNPWYCGGSFGLANPQSQVLSPFFWISLLAGGTFGLKARIVGYFALGAVGAHLLAGDVGVERGLPRFFSGATFATAGFFGFHVGGGHAAFLPFYLLPWAWLCYRRAAAAPVSPSAAPSSGPDAAVVRPSRTPFFSRAAWATGLALVWTFMLFDGGVYPLPFSVLLVGLAAAWDFVRGPNAATRAAAILVPLGAGILAVLLGAPKLWPVLDVLAELPRAVGSKDALGLADPIVMFLGHRVARAYPPHVYVWPEFASFVGPVAIALAILGVLDRPRARARELVLLVLFGAFMAGNHGPFSPYELLRRLPIYGSLRVPSRYAVVLTLLIAILGGFGLAAAQRRLAASPEQAPPSTRIARATVWTLVFIWVAWATPWLWARVALCGVGVVAGLLAAGVRPGPLRPGLDRWPRLRRAAPVALAVLALAGLAEAAAFSGAQFWPSFSRPPGRVWLDTPFIHKPGKVGSMHRYVWKNWGSVSCYDELRLSTGAIRRDAPSQVWLEAVPDAPRLAPGIGASPPRILEWSPNRVLIDVHPTTAVRLVWNMNYHRHWRASLGTPTAPAPPTASAPAPLPVFHRGLIALDLPPGDHLVELRYLPPILAPAVAASLGTALSLAVVFTLAARRRRR